MPEQPDQLHKWGTQGQPADTVAVGAQAALRMLATQPSAREERSGSRRRPRRSQTSRHRPPSASLSAAGAIAVAARCCSCQLHVSEALHVTAVRRALSPHFTQGTGECVWAGSGGYARQLLPKLKGAAHALRCSSQSVVPGVSLLHPGQQSASSSSGFGAAGRPAREQAPAAAGVWHCFVTTGLAVWP